MARLVFDAKDVKRVVEHALAAPAHQEKVIDYDKEFKAITEPGKPAVILVHDEGVYLMSNGTPHDPADLTTPDHKRFCAYALNCHPERDGDDCWDNSRELVGGDDFAETLPWCEPIKAYLDAGATHIIINFGARQLSLSAKGMRK
jgi:hypothetical protein